MSCRGGQGAASSCETASNLDLQRCKWVSACCNGLEAWSRGHAFACAISARGETGIGIIQLAGTAARSAAAHPQAHACLHNVLFQELASHQVLHAIARVCKEQGPEGNARLAGWEGASGCLHTCLAGKTASRQERETAVQAALGSTSLGSVTDARARRGEARQRSGTHPGHRGCCAVPACAQSAGPAR